jgi:hypothetical protein
VTPFRSPVDIRYRPMSNTGASFARRPKFIWAIRGLLGAVAIVYLSLWLRSYFATDQWTVSGEQTAYTIITDGGDIACKVQWWTAGPSRLQHHAQSRPRWPAWSLDYENTDARTDAWILRVGVQRFADTGALRRVLVVVPFYLVPLLGIVVAAAWWLCGSCWKHRTSRRSRGTPKGVTTVTPFRSVSQRPFRSDGGRKNCPKSCVD